MIKKNPKTNEERIVTPFTDDDLKRWKDGTAPKFELNSQKSIIEFEDYVNRLVARLETAEQGWYWIEVLEMRGSPEVAEDFRLWRKAAGKDQK
jgi:hypothetical protein